MVDSNSRLRASAVSAEGDTTMSSKQMEFTLGYLNKHHGPMLRSFVLAFSKLGREQAKRNAISGGSYEVASAEIVGISADSISLNAKVQIRGESELRAESVTISLDADPVPGMRAKYKDSPKVPRNVSSSVREASTAVDDFVRRMNRLCVIVGEPVATGKLVQLAVQLGNSGSDDDDETTTDHRVAHRYFLQENLFLNQVPHNRYVRKYFYDMASRAVLEAIVACSDGTLSNRMSVNCVFPELNTQMDSYRIGTLLEMVRLIAITLAEQNLRVRICVQQSMGVGIFTGIPKSLLGVSTLLERMDWQSGKGEENEGMVGEYINFGAIGKDHVVNKGEVSYESSAPIAPPLSSKAKFAPEPEAPSTRRTTPRERKRTPRAGRSRSSKTRSEEGRSATTDTAVEESNETKTDVVNDDAETIAPKVREQDDVFLLVCPQSMVGVESSIIGPLQEMVDAAGDRPVILLNADLTDKVSAQGQQSVRGRQQRIDFAESFKPIFHFQCLYVSGTSYFPILGALSKSGPDEPYVAYQRRDKVDGGEVYLPCFSSESKPSGEEIMPTFEK